MKKIIAVLLAVCCLTGALSGCSGDGVLSRTEYYSVIREDGTYYLQFHEEMNNDYGFTVVTYPEFDSTLEMKQSILSGEIEEYDLSWIELAKDEHGRVKLIDLDNLHVLRLPDDAESREVVWRGGNYFYKFVYDSIGHGAAACSEETCRLQYEKVTGQREEGDSNLRNNVYDGEFFGIYTHCGDEVVRREYQITDGTKTRQIVEIYKTQNDTLPVSLWIFGRENGSYFFVNLATEFTWKEKEDLPTEDWLLSFGLDKLS